MRSRSPGLAEQFVFAGLPRIPPPRQIAASTRSNLRPPARASGRAPTRGMRASWKRVFNFRTLTLPEGWYRSPAIQFRNVSEPATRSQSTQPMLSLYTHSERQEVSGFSISSREITGPPGAARPALEHPPAAGKSLSRNHYRICRNEANRRISGFPAPQPGPVQYPSPVRRAEHLVHVAEIDAPQIAFPALHRPPDQPSRRRRRKRRHRRGF